MPLPEKKYINLSDLCKEWTEDFKEKVNIERILDYALQGLIPIYMPTHKNWCFHIRDVIDADKYKKKSEKFKKEYSIQTTDPTSNQIYLFGRDIYNHNNEGLEFVRLRRRTCEDLLRGKYIDRSFGQTCYYTKTDCFCLDSHIPDKDVTRLIYTRNHRGHFNSILDVDVVIKSGYDFYVKNEDKLAFEKEHQLAQNIDPQEDAKANQQQASCEENTSPPYLDTEHKNFAPELAIAVQLWCHLYQGENIKKGHKIYDQTKKWIDGNKGKLKAYFSDGDEALTNNLAKRISIVVNPKNRKGGGVESLS